MSSVRAPATRTLVAVSARLQLGAAHEPRVVAQRLLLRLRGDSLVGVDDLSLGPVMTPPLSPHPSVVRTVTPRPLWRESA